MPSLSLSLVSGSKYDCEQRYQSITKQCEELIESNSQLQRTVKDAELRIQQLEGNKVQVTAGSVDRVGASTMLRT